MLLRIILRFLKEIKFDFVEKLIDRLFGKMIRKRRFALLHNTQFSIISNNCWGTFIYQYFGMPYLTPFIGLFIFAPDYIKLLGNLKRYLSEELIFIRPEDSSYAVQVRKAGMMNTYRVGKLLDVELHFQHYNNEKAIMEKWNRRIERIDYDYLIVKFDDRDYCTPDLIKKFDELPFSRKVCLTAKQYPYNSTLKLRNENGEFVLNYWSNFKKTVKITNFINNLMNK
jgi:uncharacterized protein (DUF1919 family)